MIPYWIGTVLAWVGLLVLASMAGGLGAFWVAKAWQRIRNGWRPRNRYPEYRPRR
jgi:hypothetical protein